MIEHEPEAVRIKYECEICHHTSYNKELIEDCEKAHLCEHNNIGYVYKESNDEAWYFNIRGVCKYCPDCDTVLNTIELEDLSGFEEKLYNLAQEHLILEDLEK